MQGFLFSYPPIAGQSNSLAASLTVVVAYEDFPTGKLRSWPLITSRRPPPVLFRVVIVCEDFATGQRARKACYSLAAKFDGCDGSDLGLWRSDVLGDPHLQDRAIREVAGADLVILSVHRELPIQTGALLEAWLAGRKGRGSALVAMLDGKSARSSAITHLSELAWRQGLDLLEQTVGDPEQPHGGNLELVWVF